jgi:hypothetical protein
MVYFISSTERFGSSDRRNEMAIEERPQVSIRTRSLGTLIDADQAAVFAHWIRILERTGIAYAVGGAFAVHSYTSIWRNTKDLDVFVRPEDLKLVLEAMRDDGFPGAVIDVFWLAKIFSGTLFMDLIFGLQNNCIRIDSEWFRSARTEKVLGATTRIIGIEELIASKMYVARRDRFDGADIVHLIRSARGRISWERLLELVKDDHLLLLWHLLLFNYVYPGHADFLPRELMVELFERVRKSWEAKTDPRKFLGMILDPPRFSIDCEAFDYLTTGPGEPPVNEEGELL